jgi:hypothetical protein
MNATPVAPGICLGLHITKCAGTSLVSTLRRLLAENEYSFCSSYYENFLATRAMFSEIKTPDMLKIYFGHYCREDLLRVFDGRNIFFFTGLREPISRALSEFAQINTINSFAGRKLMDDDQYLAGHADSMCGEILRCFPTVAARTDKSLWENARDALSMMDYVYSTEKFESHAKWILEVMALSGTLSKDNIAEQREASPEQNALMARLQRRLKTESEKWFGNDLKLYESFKRYLGVRRLREQMSLQSWAIDREEYTRALPSKEEALKRLGVLETQYLVYEFYSVGKLPELRQHMLQSIERSNAILKRVSEYEPALRS